MIVGLALFGYAVALPIYLWHRRDLRMFHRPLWAGYGSRSARLRGATICYVAAGWPEILMALGWRTSQTRQALLAERENFREGHTARDTRRS